MGSFFGWSSALFCAVMTFGLFGVIGESAPKLVTVPDSVITKVDMSTANLTPAQCDISYRTYRGSVSVAHGAGEQCNWEVGSKINVDRGVMVKS